MKTNKETEELLAALIQQPGWKAVDGILESQWSAALTDFRIAKTINEFLAAQAKMSQIEALIYRIKGQLPDYGKEKLKNIKAFQDM